VYGLSVQQPFASLIAWDEKRWETRGFQRGYRGQVVICSTVRKSNGQGRTIASVDECLMLPAFQQALAPHIVRPAGQNVVYASDLPYGMALCMVDVIGCLPAHKADEMGITEKERSFGDYSLGRYFFMTNNLRRFPEPVPIKGQLGIFEIRNPDVEAAILRQLDRALYSPPKTCPECGENIYNNLHSKTHTHGQPV
jgi:hypothetical protein